MSEQCPNCLSRRIGKKNYGKKAAGLVGASAGTFGGYSAATAGVHAGVKRGIVAGPGGATVAGIGGAVIAALLGGASGASAGVILGEILDKRVVDNLRCLDCGYSFSTDPDSRDDIC
ncbi:hypothetical protein [Marinobacter subterrani]|uniref:Uncharacterized protein n=1 Tax=Marinobacter subterrani TaxID=1658765 RepID=A0A0J7JF40_9GAMM|nr:hypothetical protein [Marinobacter subterrani]KMQ76401.1 hypothetical protein Msub_12614 [Marinobacter subterrani]